MLRAAVYRELDLTPLGPPARLRPVPVPELEVPTPTVYAVRSEPDNAIDAGDKHATVVLHRFPAITYDTVRVTPG